jgi:hypothetical protein
MEQDKAKVGCLRCTTTMPVVVGEPYPTFLRVFAISRDIDERRRRLYPFSHVCFSLSTTSALEFFHMRRVESMAACIMRDLKIIGYDLATIGRSGTCWDYQQNGLLIITAAVMASGISLITVSLHTQSSIVELLCRATADTFLPGIQRPPHTPSSSSLLPCM